MAIDWTASVANDCPVLGYEIDLMRVERSNSGSTFHVVTGGRSLETSKAFGELASDTEYQVTVTAWSQDCNASSDALTGTYRTNAVGGPDDPTVPTGKADPAAPPSVTIGRHGESAVEVTWDEPAASETMCAVSWYDLRFMREGGEWNNFIQSSQQKVLDGEYVAGSTCTADVYSYSWECDRWSQKTQATQTLE